MRIVGYVYKADIYCMPCTYEQVTGKTAYTLTRWEIENDIDEIGKSRGIDTKDEYSYDSGIWPKVVFSTEDNEWCGGCNEELH